MEDHTTIKLKIPRQDLTGLPLFQPNTDAANNWVQGLPVTNTNSLVQLLGQALSDLNRTKLAPESRYDIMEILRPNLNVALANLSKRFLNQPLIMPEEPRRMAELSDRLLTSPQPPTLSLQSKPSSSATPSARPIRHALPVRPYSGRWYSPGAESCRIFNCTGLWKFTAGKRCTSSMRSPITSDWPTSLYRSLCPAAAPSRQPTCRP